MEMLSLVNGKATLMRQMESLSRVSDRPIATDAQTELDRVRAIVSRLSHVRIQNDGEKNRQDTEKNVNNIWNVWAKCCRYYFEVL